MSELGKRLQDLLHSLDENTGPASEAALHDAVGGLVNDQPEASDEDRLAFRAEVMAFFFMSTNQDGGSTWGTYYGPGMVLRSSQGELVNVPDLADVTEEVLAHWQTRSQAAVRPFVRLRYADLIWDLSRRTVGRNPDVRYARAAIDATLVLIQRRDFQHEIEGVMKLRRALSLALSIGDNERIAAVRDAMTAFEDLVADDGKPGLWGFSLDALAGNKKVPLDEAQRAKLIEDMEARLGRLSNPISGQADSWAAEAAAMHLVKFYRSQARNDDVRRVFRLLCRAYVNAAESAIPAIASAGLRRMFDIFHNEGMIEDAEALTQQLDALAARANEDMQLISVEMPVSKNEMDLFLAAMTEGSLDTVLTRLAFWFVLDRDEIAKQVKEGATEAPFQALLSHSLVDRDGRVVATVGSVDDDLEGRVVLQMAENLRYASVFLRAALERIESKFAPSKDQILDYLYRSPVYSDDVRPLVSAGLDAYLGARHADAAHLLVPRIEDALRHLLRFTGGAPYKPNRGSGGLLLKTLDDVLRSSGVRDVLGDESVEYLRCLLTDQRGWNLRNDVSHGLLPAGSFGSGMTDRLFHVLLLLAQIRVTPRGENGGGEPNSESHSTEAVKTAGEGIEQADMAP